MPQAPVMFDLEKHGEEQLGFAIRHLPAGGRIILAQSGLSVAAIPGSARRFSLRLPPKVDYRPEVNQDAFKAATTATEELVRLHKEVTDYLKETVPPEWQPDEEE